MNNNISLPNNSNKFKENQNYSKEIAKPKKVIQGTVSIKKKSAIKEFFDNFISEDANKIHSYVVGDVLIPSIKRAISDIVTNTVDILFYGEAGKNKKYSGDRISYNNYSYNSNSYNYNNQNNRNDLQSFLYENISFASYTDAKTVLDSMYERLETYGMVSVSELNEFIGVTGSYTDNKFGWTSLNKASISYSRDGYQLVLPRPSAINNI